MAPVIALNYMTARLPYGSTMESSHIAPIQIADISKQARQIHISPKMKISPLISLGVLCEYGCTHHTRQAKKPVQKMYNK